MYKLTISTVLLALSTTNYADCDRAITRTAPDSRYELLNNNEVKDLQTGLIWQRCRLGQKWRGTSCTGTPTLYNWKNALQAAKKAENKGNAWRVPNIKELQSLIDYACKNPVFNETYFPNTQKEDGYWSSTTYASDPDYVWVLYGDGTYGEFSTKAYTQKAYTHDYFLRLVRSGG